MEYPGELRCGDRMRATVKADAFMPLTAGTRLGPYEILAPLGAGGMGEVYKARDSRLDRTVAVKTLPASVADSAEARQRFEREARAISRLSHPHVCALFDVGNAGGIEYLVMELLDGETLAARLMKGPVPLSQILRWGREMADALAAAHRQGIVHRDLKPGNVMLTSSGVKLLDFGLAKSVAPASVGKGGDVSTAALPTSLTEEGSFLGTAPYMSPEQIQGQPADTRSDVFALGAVLYEMTTGRRAFAGTSPTAIAAAVLHQDPPSLAALRPDAPPSFDRLVRTCLAKDAASRWQTAHDVALQLAGIEEDTRQAGPASAGAALHRAAWLPWAVAIAAVAVTGASWIYFGRAKSTAAAPIDLQLVPPTGRTYWFSAEGATFALSDDGTRLAFIAEDPTGIRQVWIRSLGAIDAKPISGTEGASSVFWRPDGGAIAFFVNGVLKRLDLSSGLAVKVCDVRKGAVHTGSWGSSGLILFASVEGDAVFSVSSAGGEASAVIAPDRAKGDSRTVFPAFLPDGRRFLYLKRMSNAPGQLMLGESGKPSRVVMPAESSATFVDPGFLVYAKEGTLVARRFDASSGEASGAEQPLADSVRYFFSTGSGSFAASRSGSLVYQSQRDRDRLAWVDRSGREVGTVGTAGDYTDMRLVPSGRQVLFSRSLPATSTYDVWSLELDSNLETRLTPDDSASEFAPILLTGGREMVLASTFGGPPQLARMNLETGEKTLLLPFVPQFTQPDDVSADGVLAYEQRSGKGFDIWIVLLAGTPTPTRLQASSVSEGGLRFSPDGKSYTFGSFESGGYEGYIASMAGGQKKRFSTGGLLMARWNPNGREIIYLSADGRLVAVPVRTLPALELGQEETLAVLKGTPWIDFDVAPEGKRLLAVVRDLVAAEQPLTAKLGWVETIARSAIR